MSRRRQDVATVRISDEEYSRLESKLEALKNEFTACRRKLDSKGEALLILSQELDQCRSERDQFKLMAEQLRERCQTMKRSMSGQPKQSTSDTELCKSYTDSQSQNLARLLYESRECNKSLKFETDDLKQKLHDAQGDIKLLREQIARTRVGTTDEGMNTRHFPAHEREELVQKLEASNEQYLQLERDLQTVLDEKQELVTERDVYKTKYERLNQELNYILKGDENRVVDIDAVIMENKYLQDRLKQMEEERSMAMAAVSKYKSLLEKKKTKSSLKLGQSRGGGMIITQKQVQQVLESKQSVLPTPQAMSDLQGLAGALLDSVNDKNLALSHQRKTNKILGTRVAELEKKIKTLECAGLWSIPSNVSSSLEKLKNDYDDMKTLTPRKHSSDSDRLSASDGDRDSELETVTPLHSAATSPLVSPQHIVKPASHVERTNLDTDLDLLPTKEVPTKSTGSHAPNFISDKFQYPSPEIFKPSLDIQNVLQRNDHNKFIVGKEKLKSRDRDLEVASLQEHEIFGTEMLNDREDENLHSSSQLEEIPCSVHIYNQDKLEETIDCQTNSDNEDYQVEESNELKPDKFSTCNDADIEADNLEKFYKDGDLDSSERVGLLIESVAKKMCNISHQGARDTNADSGINDDGECEKDVACKSVVCRNERSLSQDSASDGCPLFGSPRDSVDEKTINIDEPHNVEC